MIVKKKEFLIKTKETLKQTNLNESALVSVKKSFLVKTIALKESGLKPYSTSHKGLMLKIKGEINKENIQSNGVCQEKF